MTDNHKSVFCVFLSTNPVNWSTPDIEPNVQPARSSNHHYRAPDAKKTMQSDILMQLIRDYLSSVQIVQYNKIRQNASCSGHGWAESQGGWTHGWMLGVTSTGID